MLFPPPHPPNPYLQWWIIAFDALASNTRLISPSLCHCPSLESNLFFISGVCSVSFRVAGVAAVVAQHLGTAERWQKNSEHLLKHSCVLAWAWKDGSRWAHVEHKHTSLCWKWIYYTDTGTGKAWFGSLLILKLDWGEMLLSCWLFPKLIDIRLTNRF